MSVYKSRRAIPLMYGIVLVILVVILQSQSVQGNPQIRNDNDWFNERLKESSDDWFKTKREEYEKSSSFKNWEENSRRSRNTFWMIAGIMFGVFMLIVVTCICCFFIPVCCFAKAIANRRSRGMYHQPMAQPAQTQPVPGTYPTYPTQPMKPRTGYPYDQNHMALQQQPLAPGQQPQNVSQNFYPSMPVGPIPSETDFTAQLPYNPYLGGNYPASIQPQPQPPGPGYPLHPPPYSSAQ